MGLRRSGVVSEHAGVVLPVHLLLEGCAPPVTGACTAGGCPSGGRANDRRLAQDDDGDDDDDDG